MSETRIEKLESVEQEVITNPDGTERPGKTATHIEWRRDGEHWFSARITTPAPGVTA